MVVDPTAAPGRTPFLTVDRAAEVRERFGTPCYVYDRAGLEAAARQALAFPAPFGLTLRYAMKANPSRGILTLFRDLGLHVDASSDHEVERALRAGFPPGRDPAHLADALAAGRRARGARGAVQRLLAPPARAVRPGRAGPRAGGAPEPGARQRLHPAHQHGRARRRASGSGTSASREVTETAARYRLVVRTLHSHIGSGTDPDVWTRAARMTLDLATELPDVTAVNLGGGFKVGRMPEEPTTDLAVVGARVQDELLDFHRRHGRALRLEIEPGTYLVARAGAVVATCVDVVETGKDGYRFAKLDTGMTEVTRPSLYGAQHPIDVLAGGREPAEVVFVGPCCESGDILTPAPGDPEALAPRWVPRPQIGDLVVVGGAGAYCAAMSTINYNSYPQAPEVMLEPDGTLRLLRRRQPLEQVWANEV